MKRLISLALAVMLTLSLFAGCQANTSETGSPYANSNSLSNEYVYVPEYITLSDEIVQMSNATLVGGEVYFVAEVLVGTETQYVSDNGSANTVRGNLQPGSGGFAGIIAQSSAEQAAERAELAQEIEAGGEIPAGYHAEEVEIYEQQLFHINPDGSGYAKVSGFTHPETPDTAPAGTNWQISLITASGEDSAWLCETGSFGYFDNVTSAYHDDSRLAIRKVNLSDGAILSEVDASKLLAESTYFNVSAMIEDASGNLCVLSSGGTTYIFDENSQLRGNVTPPQNARVQSLLNYNGSAALVYTDGTGANKLSQIDTAKAKLGADLGTLPYEIGTVVPSSGGSLMYYNSTALYTATPGNSLGTELVNWLNSDVDGASLTVLGTPDNDSVLCQSITYRNNRNTSRGGNVGFAGSGNISVSAAMPGANGGGAMRVTIRGQETKNEFILLRKTPVSEVAQKQIITLAANGLNSTLRTAILEFNKRSPDYRVKVTDYSVYNSADNQNMGIEKLNTEIISGNIPDVLQTDSLSVSTYISKGLLEDLYSFIDADTTLGGRDALVSAFLNSVEADEKLYQISSGFSITTLVGNPELVGEATGWTMDELNAALAANPESRALPEYTTRAGVLESILTYNLEEYINTETGECAFDTASFTKLLEYIKIYPESYDWSGGRGRLFDETSEVMSGAQLLYPVTLNGFDEVMNVYALFSDNPAFKGFPSESKNGFSIEPELSLAMSAKSTNKEGAWSFISSILGTDWQSENSTGFPTNLATFENLALAAMTENTEPSRNFSIGAVRGSGITNFTSSDDGGIDNNGDGEADIYPKGSISTSGGSKYYYALTKTNYNNFIEFLNKLNRTSESNRQLSEIINDELGAFFNGQKSAAETAGVIQSRASIYISEHR